jgi:hypothetical protein
MRAVTLLLLATGVGTGRAQTEPHQDFICVSGASRRVVSMFNLDAADAHHPRGGCRVDYTRDGETRTVFTSTTGRAYCAAKAALLVTTLASGNYSCHGATVEKPDEAVPP